MIVVRQAQYFVLLFNVTAKRMTNETDSVLPADRFGLVGRERVQHDDLVRHALERLQASADVLFLVEGDDDGGKSDHDL